MNNKEFIRIYHYIEKMIPELKKELKENNNYILNHYIMNAIKYNKELDIKTGIIKIKQVLNTSEIERPLDLLENRYYGRDNIDPLKIVIIKERNTYINKAFYLLPNKLKMIIYWHIYQNYEINQLSKKLDKSILEIKKDLNLGLALFKYYYIYYCHIAEFLL